VESYTDRRASWLESFFDLIVAIVVLQLSINLSHDISISGFFKFVALFIPVFWAWIGVTFYATRFGTDDIIHRFLMLLQIGVFAFMAVNIPDGLGSNSGWFALSYAASRAILVVEYLRAGRHVPSARKLTASYSIGFSISTAIWFISVFVPPPLRFILWIIGLAVDIGIPLLFTKQFSMQFAPHTRHLPERFGLFTIIVLGIAILGIVDGIATHQWTVSSMVTTALGLGMTFSLWWLYFDNLDGSEIRALRENKQLGVYVTWLYIHIPLIIGFTALGVGVEHVVLSNQSLALPSSESWLLCVSTSICLASIGVIEITSAKSNATLVILKWSEKYTEAICNIATAAVVLFIGATLSDILLPVFFMAIIAASCIAQVIVDIRRHPFHREYKF
jgi:low temperature requirement protein LtrA